MQPSLLTNNHQLQPDSNYAKRAENIIKSPSIYRIESSAQSEDDKPVLILKS